MAFISMFFLSVSCIRAEEGSQKQDGPILTAARTSSEDLTDKEKKRIAKKHYKAGLAFYEKALYVQASQEFEAALEFNPREAKYFEELSRTRLALRESIGIPKDFRKNELKGKILEILSDTREIVLSIGVKERLQKGQWCNVYRQGTLIAGFAIASDIKGAQARIVLDERTLTKLTVDDDVEVDFAFGHFIEAVNAFDDRNYEAAVKNFGIVCAYRPTHDPSFRNIGIASALAGKYGQSALALEEAALLNPYSLFVQKDLAHVYSAVDPPEAQALIAKVLEAHFQETELHYLSGLLYFLGEDIGDALSEYMIVYNLEPEYVPNLLALQAGFLKEGNVARALEYAILDPGEKEIPDATLLSYALCMTAVCHQRLGNNVKAQQYINEAIALSPECAQWRDLLEGEMERLNAYLKDCARYALRYAVSDYFSRARLSEYEQSPVVMRHAREVLLAREKFQPPPPKPKIDLGKPCGFSGALTTTFEHYNRDPSTSYPISGTHVTEKIELEQEMLKRDVSLEMQGFRNKWDGYTLDYYKINIEDDDDEVDIGEFSVSHFADLIKHGEIKYGFRYWSEYARSAKEPEADRFIHSIAAFEEGEAVAPNIGRMFEEEFVDRRLFKKTELTMVAGNSKESFNVGEKKEENNDTYWSTGQFRRDVYAVRIMSEPTDNSALGISYVKVKDDISSATTSSSTDPINNDAVGLDLTLEFFDEKLEATWEVGWTQYDPDQLTEDDQYSDVGSLFDADFEVTDEIDLGYTRKRIGKNYKLDGGSQTQDKVTDTFTFGYARSSAKRWTLDSFDLKLEWAKTNLNKDQSTRKRYRTINPQIAFTILNDAELSFDYKVYTEEWTSLSTLYKTKTLQTDLDWEWERTKTTFKPSYTFERKDDSALSATDEKKEDVSFTIENDYWDKLSFDFSVSKEHKTYVGSSTRAYTEKEYSCDVDYELTERWDIGFEYSWKDRLNTTSDNYQLETLKLTASYESASGNNSVDLTYEHKNNPYEPNISSAYNRDYFEIEWTMDF
ncbi:MAG: hypothetical protein JW844_05935 [Candidatus Omnitrophica bacterium]|nr:hypothetical protein [Candidatus Omnitrophota bacterium]